MTSVQRALLTVVILSTANLVVSEELIGVALEVVDREQGGSSSSGRDTSKVRVQVAFSKAVWGLGDTGGDFVLEGCRLKSPVEAQQPSYVNVQNDTVTMATHYHFWVEILDDDIASLQVSQSAALDLNGTANRKSATLDLVGIGVGLAAWVPWGIGIGVVGLLALVIYLYRTNKDQIVAFVRDQVEKRQDISQKLDGVLANSEFEDFTDCKFENGARTELRIQMDKPFTDNESYARQMKRSEDLDSARELKRGGAGEKKEPSKRGGRSNIVAGSSSKQTLEPSMRQQENFGLGSEYSRGSSPGDNGSSVVQAMKDDPESFRAQSPSEGSESSSRSQFSSQSVSNLNSAQRIPRVRSNSWMDSKAFERESPQSIDSAKHKLGFGPPTVNRPTMDNKPNKQRTIGESAPKGNFGLGPEYVRNHADSVATLDNSVLENSETLVSKGEGFAGAEPRRAEAHTIDLLSPLRSLKGEPASGDASDDSDEFSHPNSSGEQEAERGNPKPCTWMRASPNSVNAEGLALDPAGGNQTSQTSRPKRVENFGLGPAYNRQAMSQIKEMGREES